MAAITSISGCNFSGRSARLREMMNDARGGRGASYIGPYGEAALSGYATYIPEEIFFYHGAGRPIPELDFFPEILLTRKGQRVSSLSGGEQVLLALFCFAGSRLRRVGIDTALEQLDDTRRNQVLSYLCSLDAAGRSCILIDNRLDEASKKSFHTIDMPAQNLFPLNMAALLDDLPPRPAPTFHVRNLNFAYTKATRIFEDVSVSLHGGAAYRLRGENGAGKSTFLKIMTGVLPSDPGTIFVDSQQYEPNRHGNLLIALAMQNPDDQWAGTSIQRDTLAKLKALSAKAPLPAGSRERIVGSIARFGLAAAPEQHLLDLPKALRKRLSWLWPLSGCLPWLAFDEPTIGQDQESAAHLACVFNELARKGYGILFITHNQEFAGMVAHEELLFRERRIVNAGRSI